MRAFVTMVYMLLHEYLGERKTTSRKRVFIPGPRAAHNPSSSNLSGVRNRGQARERAWSGWKMQEKSWERARVVGGASMARKNEFIPQSSTLWGW